MEPQGLPRPLRWLLARVLPAGRRDEVLADLEESHRARIRRLGEGAARRRLWREAAALVAWRMGLAFRRARPGRATRPSAHGDGGRDTADGRMTTMGRDFLQDLRYGVRTLLRRPAFAVTAVLVLGVGIGAPTTVLTLVERIFFERPAHVAEPHRLVRLWRSWGPGQAGGSLQHPDYRYYRANASTLDGLAAFGGDLTASYTLDGVRFDQLQATFVSDNWFDVLGVEPHLGRTFRPEENAEPGTHPAAVVSHAFWQGALGGDPDALGRSVTVNGIPLTVVGVAPSGFRGLSPFSDGPDVWAPIAMFGALTRAARTSWWERLPNNRTSWLSVVGRLAPGMTFEAARSNLEALSASLTYPEKPEEEAVLVTRETLYRPGQASTLSTLFGVLLGAVLIVAAIATANVAVLLLSRATTRGREMGIRAALGAGRNRIFRQLLAESLVLGVAGGAVGVGLAFAFSDAAASLLPFPFVGTFTPDLRVLLAAVGLSLVTAVLAGLAPALHGARADVAPTMEGTRLVEGRSRLRDGLVVAQVALSLVLVAGAFLFARSFWTASTQELGFATDDRLIVQVDLQARGYTEEDGHAFVPRALDRLGGLAGVRAVTTTRQIPFQGDWSTDFVLPDGPGPDTEDGVLWVGLNTVSPGYFDVMDVAIVRGRAIGPQDGPSSAPVMVVNETLARRLWPDHSPSASGAQDPLGRTLQLFDDRSFTVVGVAADATYYELGEEPTTQAWGSVLQVYDPLVHFVVHTEVPAAELAGPVQAALRELDPNLAFGWVSSLDAVFEEVTARYQVSAALMSLFGFLALVLATAGLYGVVSFLVARRTREIGVRMALGANRARVAREVLGSGLLLAGVGVILGLGGALVLRRLTESLLFGVTPEDPWVLAAAASVLVAVAALASLGPARRATRVDPSEALRAE